VSEHEYPTTYVELADILANLALITREACRARHLTQRAAALQMGLSPSTITRLFQGADVSLDGATAILRWLDQPAEEANRG
jgi:transcriptional regulator with XRE-family HTH domain